MLTYLRNLFMPAQNSFVIEEVDHLRNVVVVEDKELSLRVEVPIGDKPLKNVEIVGPYAVLLTYKDGSQQKRRILK